MRASLQAITEELRRLKLAGVATVPVADETLERLRRVVGRRAAASAVGWGGTGLGLADGGVGTACA